MFFPYPSVGGSAPPEGSARQAHFIPPNVSCVPACGNLSPSAPPSNVPEGGHAFLEAHRPQVQHPAFKPCFTNGWQIAGYIKSLPQKWKKELTQNIDRQIIAKHVTFGMSRLPPSRAGKRQQLARIRQNHPICAGKRPDPTRIAPTPTPTIPRCS